jgi:hypothetical protein
MIISVTIHVSFPKSEFNIPSAFSDDLSLGYQGANKFFYLGVVTDMDAEKEDEVYFTLEVRKDETPVWYLKGIIASAMNKEILLLKADKCIMRRGRITSVEIPQEASKNDIVFPFSARLFAKNENT